MPGTAAFAGVFIKASPHADLLRYQASPKVVIPIHKMTLHHASGDSEMGRDLLVRHAFSQLQKDHRSWHDVEDSEGSVQAGLILFLVEPNLRCSGVEEHLELRGAM